MVRWLLKCSNLEVSSFMQPKIQRFNLNITTKVWLFCVSLKHTLNELKIDFVTHLK